MTNSNNQKDISRILWSNAQINSVSFKEKNFAPSDMGHGIFVKTLGQDVIYDLRLAKEKPFWGHTHPLMTQHNFKNLNHPLEQHFYSVPKTEYVKIIETFQKVHFSEILDPNFKITYHNIVINFDESILDYDFEVINKTLAKLINENSDTFFWLVEQDLILCSLYGLFNFQSLMQSSHVHLCLDFHFISSTFIYSHHLFSEDSNIQLFLGIKKFFNKLISTEISGKNLIDQKSIDKYINDNQDLGLKRVGRYIISNKVLNKDTLNNNGILFSEQKDKTIFAFPLACTQDEILDVLERIKKSI